MRVIRLRTINQSHKDVLAEDPNSSLTVYAIRQLVNQGKISHICRGNKFLINYDELLAYLGNRTVSAKGVYVTDDVEVIKPHKSRFAND